MNTFSIKMLTDLAQVLGPLLPSNKQFQYYTEKNLVLPGENYASLILDVDVILKDADKPEEEVISLVVKLPPTNEFLQRLNDCNVTFKNEINFYRLILPTLQDFQRTQGCQNIIDFCPKYYGSRFSSDPTSDKVDLSAILILENLKRSDFEVMDRLKGLDLQAAKLVCKNLAIFHAVSLALKMKHPQVFERNIDQVLVQYKFFGACIDDGALPVFQEIFNMVQANQECAAHLSTIKKMIPNLTRTSTDSPFATLIHNDCWINNVMFKLDDQGKPAVTKFVDFQVCYYDSPAKDLLFFIFGNVQTDVCEHFCDDLIAYYHQHFISTLLELKCNVAVFSIDALRDEIARQARTVMLLRIICLLFCVFRPKAETSDSFDFSEEEINNIRATQAQKERTWFVIREFAKRNWI